jgi:hypothetical protein
MSSTVLLLQLLFTCIQLSMLKVPKDQKNLIFTEQAKSNLILLTDDKKKQSDVQGDVSYLAIH